VSSYDVSQAGAQLGEIVAGVAAGERPTLTQAGAPVAVICRPRDLRSLEESVEMLSNREALTRIVAGENAFQVGDVLAGSDLGSLDPSNRFHRPGSARGAAAPVPEDEWEIAVSRPAAAAIARMPQHVADVVLRFLFERLLLDPVGHGVELRGSLSRRFVAHAETEIVVYRLDSVKRVVRVIEVLHFGGMLGQPIHQGQHW
jgi:prevent-host-death family protein